MRDWLARAGPAAWPIMLVVAVAIAAVVRPAPAGRAQGAAEDVLRETLGRCPFAGTLESRLRERWAAGRLVVDPAQSVLRDLLPSAAALADFAGRLRRGEPVTPDSPLGWLLTQPAAPRYPDNPYVTWTRDLGPTAEGDASYESLLAARLAANEGPLLPGDLLRLALELTGDDYPLATLVAHNLLKELAFASRDQTAALVGWSPADRGSVDEARALGRPTYRLLSQDEVRALAAKLVDLRPDGGGGGQHLPAWYYLFGTLFLGAVTHGSLTPFGPEAEILTSWLLAAATDDPFLATLNACGTALVEAVGKLDRSAVSASAPGAGTSGPPAPFAVPAPAEAVVGAGTAGASLPAAPGASPGPALSAAPAPPAAPVLAPPLPGPPGPVPAGGAGAPPLPGGMSAAPPTPLPAPVPTSVPALEGLVRNAITGQPLAGVTVSVPSANRLATTDATGRYQLVGLPPGPVQATAAASGFVSDTATVTVPPTGTVTQHFALSPSLLQGQLRIVLTWANTPRDLDAHLWAPAGPTPVEVWYRNRGTLTGPPFAQLDTDDRDGIGPETITVGQVSSGQYTYAVHQYSNDGTLAASNARVQILREGTVLQTFTVPAGRGRWWTVFTLDGTTGTVTPVNTLGDTPPVRVVRP